MPAPGELPPYPTHTRAVLAQVMPRMAAHGRQRSDAAASTVRRPSQTGAAIVLPAQVSLAPALALRMLQCRERKAKERRRRVRRRRVRKKKRSRRRDLREKQYRSTIEQDAVGWFDVIAYPYQGCRRRPVIARCSRARR
jgi:hypothetical protein